MTHHEKAADHEFDPDFDAAEPAPVKHHAAKQVTFSFALTPLKLFLGGFIAGLLVMAAPTAYLYAKQGTGVGSPGGFAGAPLPSNGAPAAPQVGTVKPVSKDDHIRGSKDAKVVLVEYSDLECPFCKRFHATVKQAVDEYKGDVAWVYRHFPLSFHANAQKEAEAAECVASLGGNDKFWPFIDKIFERTTATGTGFALDQLGPLAKEVGVDQKKFQECLDSGKMTERVNKDLQEGQAAGVDGTPGTILVAKNGTKSLVPGAVPIEELKSQIDALLK